MIQDTRILGLHFGNKLGEKVVYRVSIGKYIDILFYLTRERTNLN
jgi:hypothetical protein